jgi:hypothetical protein
MIGDTASSLWLAVPDALGVLVPLASDSNDEGEAFLMLVLGFGLGLFLIYDGFNKWRIKRMVEDTPTEKTRSMAVGRTELDGVARADGETIEAPFTDEACLHVSWEIEEWREDEDDDHHWETIAQDRASVPFYLEDDTGRVLVRADAGDPEFEISEANETRFTTGRGESAPAEVQEFFTRRNRRTRDNGDSLLGDPVDAVTDLLGGGGLSDSGRKRRYTQTVLPDGADVYILGSALPRDDAAGSENETRLEVTRDEDVDVFLISDRSEAELESRYERLAPIETVGGLALSAVCLFVILRWFVGL